MSAGRTPLDGPGRLLAVIYAIFAISAGARSAFQIANDFSLAPLAYCFSAAAAAIYLLAALCFWWPSARAWGVAVVALAVELVGVLAVGTLSLMREDAPQRDTIPDMGVGPGRRPRLRIRDPVHGDGGHHQIR